MERNKEYIEREGQTLSISIFYDLGGTNYFSGEINRRGYYMAVRPVSVSRSEDGRVMTESSIMFNGTKMLLVEVNRQSKKAEAEALKKAEENKERLIESVMNEYVKKV